MACNDDRPQCLSMYVLPTIRARYNKSGKDSGYLELYFKEVRL